MAINFPSNPSLNDTFTSGGVVFIWNGSSWSSSTVSEISNDATPRLGGDLDVDGNTIEGTGDINLTGIVTATSANFSGNVSIGGTLTYEDVTNIDSVGLITARSGVNVSAGGINVSAGGINVSAGGINVTGVTTTGAVNWGGHMLPTSDSVYDIGSADYKIRHIFVSDNSLKFIDSSDVEHPLSVDSGRLKFAGGLLLGTTIKADTTSGIVTATTFSGSGASLTNLDASDLSTGTIPDARFPSVLPAVSGANLTNLPDNVASWTLGADGISNYTFSGPGLTGAESDPTIYLQRGVTYKFVNTMNAHPFRIQSTENGSTGTQYNDGITNNDVSNGTLEWDVQFDAPNELYYQCTAHSNMGGKIIIGGGGGEGFSQLDTWLYG